MAHTHCPVCFELLEVRTATPCVICGGWPESVKRLDPQSQFHEWRLPNGQRLILCKACELEEFMVPGGWGFRLGLTTGRVPLDSLQRLPTLVVPRLEADKFCPLCNLRLAFLKIISSRLSSGTHDEPTPFD
jgi:hypothetical protein